MKKYIRALSLILALSLCLSMAACSSDDKAFKEADALLAAGDYDGAIAAFSAIGRYEEISAKIAEAEKLRNEANMGFLFGTWKDLNSGYTFTLREDGTFTLSVNSEIWTGTYTYENNTVTISQPMVLSFELVDENGVTHLVSPAYGDFVSEADYAAIGPVAIELTMDNWQEYFELREVYSIDVNSFGEISEMLPSAGIFLKEEYYSRLVKNPAFVDISFELIYDQASYQILNCDPDYDYSLSGKYESVFKEQTETDCTQVVNIRDLRELGWPPEQSPYYNTFSGEARMDFGGWHDDKEAVFYQGINIRVNRVRGTLMLFP